MKRDRKKPSTTQTKHTKLPPRPEIWDIAMTGDEVSERLGKLGLPPIAPQQAHDLARCISIWALSWRNYSKHPEAKTPLMIARTARNRRISDALATLQKDLPDFMADTAPHREIMFAPGFIEPLAYHVARVAPGFAGALAHGGVERWHVIADDLERSLLAKYPDAKPKPGKVTAFIGAALAAIGVNVNQESIRNRNKKRK